MKDLLNSFKIICLFTVILAVYSTWAALFTRMSILLNFELIKVAKRSTADIFRKSRATKCRRLNFFFLKLKIGKESENSEIKRTNNKN